MKYSIIIPVYNRPDEVDELLSSLTRQAYSDFEVIVVEDGSTVPCEEVCRKYVNVDVNRLDLHYYSKPNSGPGQTRNYGVERAKGEWMIILDSDVIVPEGYFEAVEKGMTEDLAAFGGPDASHPSFNAMQKAVSYSMTSFFTTGGIRGGKAKLDKFYPRSYNMGVRKDVYQALGGFSKMRYGEDIDFSYRIVEGGYKTALIPEAFVYHKRRTDLRAFFRQVEHSGAARIALEERHPGTMKLVHTLPAIFTVCVAGCLLRAPLGLIPLALYALLVCVDSTIKNRSLKVGILSIATSYTQLIGYGVGFFKAWIGKYRK